MQNGTEILVDPAGSSAAPFTGVAAIRVRHAQSALPLAGGPRQLQAPVVVRDPLLGYPGDPQGALLGAPGVLVSRMVDASR